jgi:hypothetical protein
MYAVWPTVARTVNLDRTDQYLSADEPFAPFTELGLIY